MTTDLSNTREHRGCQPVRFAVSQALCTQTSVRPWHLKSFCSSNSSPRPPLPSLQDGRCSRTYTTGLIFLRGDISWPTRSQDLTPCDYFLWGYLKAKVFKHRPRTLQALKDAIHLEVARIPQDMLDRVKRNIRICLQQCTDNNSHHLQDILFKTMWFKTSHVVVSESKNKIFESRIVFFVIRLKIQGSYFAPPCTWISMACPKQSRQPVALANPAMSLKFIQCFATNHMLKLCLACSIDGPQHQNKPLRKTYGTTVPIRHITCCVTAHRLQGYHSTDSLKAALTTLWMRSSRSHYILTVSTEVTCLSERWLQYTATKCEWRRLIQN